MKFINHAISLSIYFCLFGGSLIGYSQWKHENSEEIPDAVIITYDVIYERELTEKEKASSSFLKEVTITFNKDKLIEHRFYNSSSSTYHYKLFDYNTEKYYSCHNYKGEKTATEYSFKPPLSKATLQPNTTKKNIRFYL